MPCFPAHQRCRIDTQLRCHFPLREAKRRSRGSKALRDGIGRRLWVVADESNDGGDVADLGDGCVAFPAGNSLFVNSDLVGNLLLKEFEVQPTRANMIT